MKEIISGNRKFWASLSYLGILVLFPLTKKQDDVFIFYHTKQGIVFIFLSIILEIFIRISLQQKSWIISGIAYVIILAYIITGITNCVRSRKAPLPIIGFIADKITL